MRHQGQIVDEETGLYYNRHRYYDPQICQCLSPDPIGLAGGTRPQAYVHNPLEWVDPLGLSGCPNVSDKRHFQEANRQLHEAMLKDSSFANALEKQYPGIIDGVKLGPRGAYPRKPPASELTWHHHPDKDGVMQLIPLAQHQSPGIVQNSLHPNNKGGMQNWGGGRN